MAFVLVLVAMIAAYFNESTISSKLFLTSIMLLMISMLLFIRGIQTANTVLDVHFLGLEEHPEWRHYLRPKRLGPRKN